MPLIFDSIYLTASLLGSPYLLFKILTSKRYRSGLNQRFGITAERTGNKPGIWVHGASVGEVITAKSIIERIDKEFPEWETFISTTTNTGFSVAEKNFSDKAVFYFPADLSWTTRKVLLKKRPNLILLVELEIWPNFLISAYKKNIPVIVVNGRISNRSLMAYRAISHISKDFRNSLTNEMNTYCARTEIDAQRFRDLGIPGKQVFVTGTMKYDNIPTHIDESISKGLAELFHINDDDLVLIGGSTHAGEEEILIRVFKKRILEFAENQGLPAQEWYLFECSGSVAGQKTAFGLLTHGGTLCVVGFTMDRFELRLSNLMAFDARALGNWGCAPELYPAALELVMNGNVAVAPFVEQYPLDSIQNIFNAAQRHELTKRAVLVP